MSESKITDPFNGLNVYQMRYHTYYVTKLLPDMMSFTQQVVMDCAATPMGTAPDNKHLTVADVFYNNDISGHSFTDILEREERPPAPTSPSAAHADVVATFETVFQDLMEIQGLRSSARRDGNGAPGPYLHVSYVLKQDELARMNMTTNVSPEALRAALVAASQNGSMETLCRQALGEYFKKMCRNESSRRDRSLITPQAQARVAAGAPQPGSSSIH